MTKSLFCFSIFLTVILALANDCFGQQISVEIKLLPKRLTNVKDAYPDLSPDLKKITFMSNRTGNWEIFLMNAEFAPDADEEAIQASLIQLTNNKADDLTPVWSPDGKRIAFTSTRDGDLEIYVMNADGSNQKRLTNQPGVDGHPH